MAEEMMIDGLVIDRYTITCPADKDKVPHGLGGWKHVSYTPEEWITEVFDVGHIGVLGDMDPDDEGKYRHKKEFWNGTRMIALDWDRIAYTEMDGDEEKTHEGVEPFQDINEWWRDNQAALSEDLYALGQSVNTMSKGNPKHRRLRAYILLEEPITDPKDYENFLSGMALEYPICSDDRRSPAQPIFGFKSNYRFEKNEYGEWVQSKEGSMDTHIIGTVMKPDRAAEIIQNAIDKADENRQKAAKKPLPKPPERKDPDRSKTVVQNAGLSDEAIMSIKKIGKDDSPTLETPLQMIGKDHDFAIDYIESKGSTFVRDDGTAYHFTRSGAPDGETQEAILYGVGETLRFHAFSEKSWFVENGYADKQIAIQFTDLFWEIEHPGASFREICKFIIDSYPIYDNGWRPEKVDPMTLKPISAMNYMKNKIESYLAEHDPNREFRQIEPNWDDRYVVIIEDRLILFSYYWSIANNLKEEYELCNDYDGENSDCRKAYAKINTEAAKLVGDTGGWQSRKRRPKSKYIF